jgi:alcohol dehydrogenase
MNVATIASIRQVPLLEFGRGCLDKVAASFSGEKPETVLFIAAKSAANAVQRLTHALSSAGHKVVHVDGLPAEPAVGDFESVRTRARPVNPTAVIGIGGGSVLDVAKLVAALHDSDQSIEDCFGTGKLMGRRARLVCLPTTAGAGSEVSPNAILLDRAARLKRAVISPHLVPDSTYVDSSLCDSAPPGLTAATGLDALCHCIEAYVNRYATRLTDAWALEGVRRISGSLRRAVACGSDAVARDELSLGSLLGGLCLGPVNTTAVHALSYPLGSEHGLPHGVANALLLGPVASFNLEHAVDRYAEVASAMGVAPRSSPRESAEAGIVAIRSLCHDVLGSIRLRDWGISEAHLPGLAASGLTVTRLLDRNVRQVTLEDAIAIYRSVL